MITPTSGSFIYCDGASVHCCFWSASDTYTWVEYGTTTITSMGTNDVTILSDGSITLTIDTAAGCSYTPQKALLHLQHLSGYLQVLQFVRQSLLF